VPLALFPALDRFKPEATILGRLLTGFTAIEYQLCMCVGMGGGDVEWAIKELFSKRGETGRVNRADKLGKAAYAEVGLGQEFDAAIEDMLLCVDIRNQYAHCIWHDDRTGRLAFAHMEELAKPVGPDPDPINLTLYHVDENLLREQERFFFSVKDRLNFLNYRRRQLVGAIGARPNPALMAPRPRKHLEDDGPPGGVGR
jgi:hypothetical protein